MAQSNNLSITRIYQIVFGFLLFGMGMMAVRGLMAGARQNMQLLVAAIVGISVVLLLDKKYWILAPALWGFSIQVPGLPFSSAEIGALAIISVYFIRQATGREYRIRYHRRMLIAFPIFFWICIIWAQNPTGLAIFGNASIGARFYMRIVLGFLMMLVYSSMRLTEKDCKLLFFCLLASILGNVFRTFVLRKAPIVSEEERVANYQFLVFFILYCLLIARYQLREILRTWWLFFLTLFCFLATIFSGKRQAIALLAIYPIFRTIMTRREKAIVMVCGLIGTILLTMGVLGDGHFWDLPASVQRGLSTVVSKYSTESMGGSYDLFRDEVHRYGRELLRQHPFVGRKGYALSLEEVVWMNYGGRGTTNFFESHAYAGNWHSAWYAFACDFGLPGLFLWVLFCFCIVRWIIVDYRRHRFGTYASATYLFFGFRIFQEVLFAHVSGHSSYSAFFMWFYWGLLLAIMNGVQDAEKQIEYQQNVVV